MRALPILALLFLPACLTGMDATGAPNADGLVYYLPTPFLIIEELPGGKWDARIEYAVDRSKEFRVQPTVFFATSKATIELNTDGTMKQFALEQDSTGVPDTLITALKDLELKRLEIEQAEQKRKVGNANKAHGMFMAGGAPPLGRRRVQIYRIDGVSALPWSLETDLTTPGEWR